MGGIAVAATNYKETEDQCTFSGQDIVFKNAVHSRMVALRNTGVQRMCIITEISDTITY
jgi:hypothetical protein